MSIDDKIRELGLYEYRPDLDIGEDAFRELSDERIAQIKQAFIDEGYWKMDDTKSVASIVGLYKMTGQEWYDRFLKETAGGVFPYRTNKEQALVVEVAGFFSDATRKAAGLK